MVIGGGKGVVKTTIKTSRIIAARLALLLARGSIEASQWSVRLATFALHLARVLEDDLYRRREFNWASLEQRRAS